jgi:hypothetical protein
MEGWFKLHRKIMENPIFSDADLLRLWIFCLSKATYKQTKVMIDKQEVELYPGQFVTGRFSLYADYNLGVSPRKKVKDTTLWSWLKRLETYGNIDIKTTNKYSVVTVLKWNEYQDTLTTEPQQIDNKLTADCCQTDTNKKLRTKEVKEKEYIQLEDMPHVKITIDEFNKLVKLIGSEEKVMNKIIYFASWILGQPDKKQKSASAYLSITAWHKRDGEKKEEQKPKKASEERQVEWLT